MLQTVKKAKNILPDGNGNRSKHYVNGMSLFRYCRENGLGKSEYARCLWLIQNKCMTAEEALNYHRIPKNPNWKWIRKVGQRKRQGIDPKYVEMKDKYIIEMGHNKQAKYFYKGVRLRTWCKKHKISYSAVYQRILKLGMKVEVALKITKKDIMETIKKAPCYDGKKDRIYYKKIFANWGK